MRTGTMFDLSSSMPKLVNTKSNLLQNARRKIIKTPIDTVKSDLANEKFYDTVGKKTHDAASMK